MAYEPYPQESGTVGLAFIITNGYEGKYSLPGTQDDGTKWKEALKKLNFDVRWERNVSESATMDFLRTASRIPIDGTKCRYVVFVFCGHGKKGALVSQDLLDMNLEKEILPFFFGESNFIAVEKLIFLDACRSPSSGSYLSLSDSLSKVWRPGSGAAGYFSLCSTPSGYWARGGSSGSAFSDIVTKKLVERLTLAQVADNTRKELAEEATKMKIQPIGPVYEDNLGPNSEKILLNLSDPVGVKKGRKHSPPSKRKEPSSESEESGVKKRRKRPPQHGTSSSKRKEPSIDSEESDSSASSESFESETRKRGSKSTKRSRSYSEVTVRDVIRGMTREKLHSGIKNMLTEHRTNLLCDDWELINEECRDDILGDLKANNKTKAADRLIDYFNNNHTGEELLHFCDFLTKVAKDAGRNTQLLKLANAIKEAVHNAS